MNAVLQRELVVQGRSRLTYALRLLAGGLAVLGFYFVTRGSGWLGGAQGREMFYTLHAATCLFAALLCPLLTVEAFLRERREGTLPLLFLTPLTAGDIVRGKFTAHLLRAGSLWLAASPVLLLPIVMGGVNWVMAVGVLAVEALVVLTALIVGLAASANCNTTTGAVISAYLILGVMAAFGIMPVTTLLAGIGPGIWQIRSLAIFGSVVVAAAALVFWVVFNATAVQIRECWRKGFEADWPCPPVTVSPGSVEYVPARGENWYERRQARLRAEESPGSKPSDPAMAEVDAARLVANQAASRRRLKSKTWPLEWLWSRHGLTSGISVVLAILVGYLAALAFFASDNATPGWGAAGWLLVFSAYPAARALQADLRSGGIELLLISPLPPREFLLSHWRGCWRLLGPTIVTYVTMVVGFRWWGRPIHLPALLWLLTGLVMLPLTGFWLSFLIPGAALAAIANALLGLWMPMLLAGWAVGDMGMDREAWREWLRALFATGIMAVMAWGAGRLSLLWLKLRYFPRTAGLSSAT